MPYSAFQYLPLAVEASNNELAVAVLGVLVTLIGQHFVLKKYIREAAGVKETTTTEIAGQPIHFVKDEKAMTVGEHTAKCGPLVKRVESLEKDVKEIRSEMATGRGDILDAMTEVRTEVSRVACKVSGLDERTEATNTALSVQDKKIDAIFAKL